MNGLKVIENSLVPVYATEQSNKVVNARELHEFLESKREFATWIKDKLSKYGFVQDVDFAVFDNFVNDESAFGGKRKTIEYILKLDTAKEIAMVENNEKGRQARKYFIEVEKKYQQLKQTSQFKLPENFAEALRELASTWEENQKLLPKAESFDKFISGENLQDMTTVSKVLGWGRNKLFKELRENEVFRFNNTPYQSYIDRGYFEVKEKPIEIGGQVINKPQTYVTAKGIEWLSKTFSSVIAV